MPTLVRFVDFDHRKIMVMGSNTAFVCASNLQIDYFLTWQSIVARLLIPVVGKPVLWIRVLEEGVRIGGKRQKLSLNLIIKL